MIEKEIIMSNLMRISRQDVKQEDTWQLEDIFPSDDAVLTAFKEVQSFIQAFASYQNQVTASSTNLLEVIALEEKTSLLASKIYLYCHMRLHQDATHTFYQDLATKSAALMVQLSTATAFIATELSTLNQAMIDTFTLETPQLATYARYFSEIFRQKDHILDPATESLLSQFGEVTNAPSEIFAMFNNADLVFPTITLPDGETRQLTHGNYIQFLENPHRSVREEAFNGLYNAYKAFENTLAKTFASNVKQTRLFATLRAYPSSLEAKLSKNNIPKAVYMNLIDTVNEKLPILHDYMALRKDLLEVDTLHMYDLFVPLIKDFDKPITFDEACTIILKALEPLGADYVAIVKEAFESRWIDKYENIGKRSGAYSWGTYGLSHPYVLMNYTNNLNNLFTLAHEMGHALHSYLSCKKQPQVYAGYCIFVAEVASTVNEALLMQYLLKTTTEPLYRKYLLNHFMEQFRSTVYRQTMFAEFEHNVYEKDAVGETLTTELLCTMYYDLVKKYHGDNMVVDPVIKYEWARIPHFYTPFYVYQYATGFSAAIALSTRILNEGEPAVADYLNFLSSGSSKDPIDLLKDAGVDMSSSEPITAALSVFESLIQEMRQL